VIGDLNFIKNKDLFLNIEIWVFIFIMILGVGFNFLFSARKPNKFISDEKPD